MTIIKMLDGTYAVRTGRFTADLREIATLCRLEGNVLRTIMDGGILLCPSIRD